MAQGATEVWVFLVIQLLTAGAALYAAAGARANGRAIESLRRRVDRLAGRVDVLEHTLQTVLMILAGGGGPVRLTPGAPAPSPTSGSPLSGPPNPAPVASPGAPSRLIDPLPEKGES